MNTTKLHVLAVALDGELKRSSASSHIQNVIGALEAQLNQPQQPNHQQQVAAHLAALYDALEASPVDQFSPAWRETMVEMGVSEFFGKNLEMTIRGIFERNQITPKAALDELKTLGGRISELESNNLALIAGLEFFGVAEDNLREDECEVGIVIPRAYVNQNLKSFGEELVKLEKALLVFSELVSGCRTPLTVRQISSSELSIFLEYSPEIGACIAIAVERIAELYKKLLEIKKLKKGLESEDVPKEALAAISTHAEGLVKPKIEELADELIERYGGATAPNRKNELRTELKHSLHKIANRMDRGFNIELRVAPVAHTADDEDEKTEESASTAARRQIIQSASRIEHLPNSGAPVLSLPEEETDLDGQD